MATALAHGWAAAREEPGAPESMLIADAVPEKARALEMEVLVHDPWVAEVEIAAVGARTLELGDLLAASDVVSLHARSRGLPIIGEAQLAQMKRGSYLINTSRANQVDYDAMTRALRSGQLAGAGLDVFPDEPLPSSSPLLDLPNVTLTPHLAGMTVESRARMSVAAAEEVLRMLAGERPKNFVNPESADIAHH